MNTRGCTCTRTLRAWSQDGTCATCRQRVTEAQLQDAVRLALGAVPGLLLYRNNCGYDTDRKIRYGVGNPGGADLIGVYRGRGVAIEIKTADGVQSEDQRAFQRCWTRAGGVYLMPRSVEDAVAMIGSIEKP